MAEFDMPCITSLANTVARRSLHLSNSSQGNSGLLCPQVEVQHPSTREASVQGQRCLTLELC